MESPLHQFEVNTLLPLQIGGLDLSFTNSSLLMVIAVVAIVTLFILALRNPQPVPGKMQSLMELSYEFIANLLEENTGTKGKQYLPFIWSLFLFVLFGNLLGLIPYSFTFTSQLVVTFGLALLVFFVIIIIGFSKHGLKFFKLFLPEGAPLIMAPLLLPIELISFLSRPVSLSVRLFANMMAGHTMLKVFAFFTISLGLFGFSTILLNSILIGFEFLVAFLQAYVFTVLTCLYLNDAIHLHS
ncbi:MAG: F0F1 ATP synthase subunit A [Alphaproteobacteria bacterium]